MDSFKVLFLITCLFAITYIPGCAHLLSESHFDECTRCLSKGAAASIPLFVLNSTGHPRCLDFPFHPDEDFVVSHYVWWLSDCKWEYVPISTHSSFIGRNGIETSKY